MSAWLAANRARRCALLDEDLPAVPAGDTGVFYLRLAPGRRADLNYLRSAPTLPSNVSTFSVRAVHAKGVCEPWTKQIKVLLDDVNGSPRVKISWGPLQVAGEYIVTVSLAGQLIDGSPLRLLVCPRPSTTASASSMHAIDETGDASSSPSDVLADFVAPPEEDENSSGEDSSGVRGCGAPLPALVLTAGDEGRLYLAARDEYGNLRRESQGGDRFYAVLQPERAARPDANNHRGAVDGDGSTIPAHQPPVAAAPTSSSATAVGAPRASLRCTYRGGGVYEVDFVRPVAGVGQIGPTLDRLLERVHHHREPRGRGPAADARAPRV